MIRRSKQETMAGMLDGKTAAPDDRLPAKDGRVDRDPFQEVLLVHDRGSILTLSG